LLAAAIVIAAVATTASSGPTGPPRPAAVGVRAGSVTELAAFGTLTGTQPSVAAVSLDPNGTWFQTASAWPLFPWIDWLKQDPTRRLVLSVPMLLASSSGNFDDVALDGFHRQVARSIDRFGVSGQVIIRLGWEPNTAGLPWSGDAEGYKRMFRRLVPVYRGVSDRFTFDWAPAARIPPDPARWYPGDDVVDIVGLSQFDTIGGAPGGDPAARWAAIELNLRWQETFARTHGKKAALDAWSLWASSDVARGGGGDDPVFVTNLVGWANGHGYLYTVYDNGSLVSPGTKLVDNPGSLAAYRVAVTQVVDANPGVQPVVTPAPSTLPQGTGLGVYVAPSSRGGIQGLTQFGSGVGRPVTYAMVYADAAASLESFAEPAWMLDPWAAWLRADPARRMILAVPMLQSYAPGDFANTGYDQYFVRLAQSIKDRGIAGQVIIRLGYEMNGDWMPWGRQYSTDGSGFRAMWRRVVPQMKAVYPFLFDWSIVPESSAAAAGAGYSPNFYPGDDVVDIVGVDLYDHWVSGSPDQRWAATQAKLDWAAGFASAHSKRLTLDEWGVWSTANSQGGGDNPTYITNMLHWAFSHGLAWTSYFNSTEGSVETRLQDNPNSLNAFRQVMAGG
jgi:hypothetical protein